MLFESNGLRGAEAHATSADAPKQVGLPTHGCVGFHVVAGKRGVTMAITRVPRGVLPAVYVALRCCGSEPRAAGQSVGA